MASAESASRMKACSKTAVSTSGFIGRHGQTPSRTHGPGYVGQSAAGFEAD